MKTFVRATYAIALLAVLAIGVNASSFSSGAGNGTVNGSFLQVSHSVAQSHSASGSTQVVLFNTNGTPIGSNISHDATTNTGAIEFQARGWATFTVSCSWATSALGTRELLLQDVTNAVQIPIDQAPASSTTGDEGASITLYVTAGQVFTIKAFQNTTGALNINSIKCLVSFIPAS